MRSKTITIVAASPGWSLATLIKACTIGGETYPATIILNDVIAWEIQQEEHSYHPIAGQRPGETFICTDVTPITTDGSPHNLAKATAFSPPAKLKWAIKRPDGKFDLPGAETFDTEAELIAALGG